MDGQVGDVDLVADLPETEVAAEPRAGPGNHAASDPVLGELVAESGARPRGLEGDTLDGQDIVEVVEGHGRQGQRRPGRRLTPGAPRRAGNFPVRSPRLRLRLALPSAPPPTGGGRGGAAPRRPPPGPPRGWRGRAGRRRRETAGGARAGPPALLRRGGRGKGGTPRPPRRARSRADRGAAPRPRAAARDN